MISWRLPKFNRIIWVMWTLLLIGCSDTGIPSTDDIEPVPLSLWGSVFTVAQTQQANAPAVWSNNGITAFAWVGSDRTGVHHDVRVLTSERLSPTAALPLSPNRPTELRVTPSLANNTHLLYLDANAEGETRLYSAVFSPTLALEFGPTPISTRRTDRYTFIPEPKGALWVVWSGGLLSERTLYAQRLDLLGRPRSPELLIADADYPSLSRGGDGTVYLFWLRPSTNNVYRARFSNGQITDIGILTQSVRLPTGTRLINFTSAHDEAYSYLFWNIVTADGTPQTWYTAAESNAATWDMPRLLMVGQRSMLNFETGFNGGAAFEVNIGETPVRWASPLNDGGGNLPVAAQVENTLAVVYLQDGRVAAYRPIVTLRTDLIGLPLLTADSARHLYLAWSQMTETGNAQLYLTTTRPY